MAQAQWRGTGLGLCPDTTPPCGFSRAQHTLKSRGGLRVDVTGSCWAGVRDFIKLLSYFTAITAGWLAVIA